MPESSRRDAKRGEHFRQGRFGAVTMDEEYLAAALRYLSLNPVRARWLVERAGDWRRSSTRAHLRGKDDGIPPWAPSRIARFADLLDNEPEADLFERLRAAESIGGRLGTIASSHASSDRRSRPQAGQAWSEARGRRGRQRARFGKPD